MFHNDPEWKGGFTVLKPFNGLHYSPHSVNDVQHVIWVIYLFSKMSLQDLPWGQEQPPGSEQSSVIHITGKVHVETGYPQANPGATRRCMEKEFSGFANEQPNPQEDLHFVQQVKYTRH